MESRPPGKTVLLVDDDDDLREATALMLEAEGYRVRRATDGDQGVRMALEERPDLILLDLLMPGKNGCDASRELRQIPGLGDVPILALTAFGEDIAEICATLHCNAPGRIQGCLEKPIEPTMLLERVASAMASPSSA